MSTCDVGAVDDFAHGRCIVADPGDRERHTRGLVVQGEPLLMKASVRTEQVAMIGRPYDHGVLSIRYPVPVIGDRPPHLVDRRVDLGVQAVVEVAVLLRPLCRRRGRRAPPGPYPEGYEARYAI